MTTIDLNDLDRIGSIRDQKPFMLPPEAWTTALNMRVEDGEIKRLLGWEQIFGTPGVAPHFLMPVVTASAAFWMYTSLTKAYGYDGTTHTDITRAAGDYTASNTREWNGTLLGGVPILNNGVDVPQSWNTISLATDLVNLANWGANVRAKVMRAFGPFLIAFHITDTGSSFPHLVRWSHPADPGSVPSSWDVTDPTKDTGQQDLSDVNAGVIQEALQLGGFMYIYKDNSTWRMRFVGGRKIFDFGEGAWLTTSGILAPRCVCVADNGTKQVVVTQDDVIWHDGNKPQSILDQRWRHTLFNQIDTSNFLNTFVFDNPGKQEVWVCYPSVGMTNPNRALILSYAGGRFGAITEADGINFRNAAVGPVQSPAIGTWDSDSITWDDEEGTWDNVERRRVVAAATGDTKFWGLDRGLTRNGSTFTATLQREGISLLGRKRSGEWIVDHQIMKLFLRVWPKITGAGPILVRFATQQLVDGPISWGNYYSFDPTTGTITRPLGVTADPLPASGRAIGVEFTTIEAVQWGMSGYKIDLEPMGQF